VLYIAVLETVVSMCSHEYQNIRTNN